MSYTKRAIAIAAERILRPIANALQGLAFAAFDSRIAAIRRREAAEDAIVAAGLAALDAKEEVLRQRLADAEAALDNFLDDRIIEEHEITTQFDPE